MPGNQIKDGQNYLHLTVLISHHITSFFHSKKSHHHRTIIVAEQEDVADWNIFQIFSIIFIGPANG